MRTTAAAALLLVLSLSACSEDSSEPSADPTGGPSSTEATEAPALETTVTLGKVVGRLPKEKRSNVRRQVGRAVDAWFEAAYVGGDYPRNDFADSWPGFTTGAKADARADKVLMSNQGIGQRVEAVDVETRKLFVDVLAPRGRASGATARFVLRFSTEGDVERKIEVRGRLFLTPTEDGWRVFGYDVSKGRWS
jgi:hypothetical protein